MYAISMLKMRSLISSLIGCILCISLLQNPGVAAQTPKPSPKNTPAKPSPSKQADSNTPKNDTKSELGTSNKNVETNTSTSKPSPSKPADSNSELSTSSKNVEPINSPAKKSANSKVNPSTVIASKINSKAQKVSKLASKPSPACQANTSAEKAKLANDPCSDFIIVFTPGFAKTKSQELLKQSNAQVKQDFQSIFNGAVVNAPLSKMVALTNNPNVLVVEDDLKVTTFAIQNSAPWGLDRIDQTRLPLSNTFDDLDLTGVNTYSFVVDTGIDADNNEFSGRVASGFTAISDGRGSKDCNGHGTHVAGIIGANTFGVAKNTNLIPVRVLDCSGAGSYSSVIAGLDWIAANYTPGTAAVVNMSLGGAASSTLDGAVSTLISKGINVVVAAGNSNTDACKSSPARVPDALTIAATDRDDNRASYSNFGTCIDLFAPGSSIISTWLGANGVNTISGTSMSAPNVSGIVARFISVNSSLTPQQVANSIKSSSTKNVVIGAGAGSLNQIAYMYVTPNLTIESPSPTPTFKKVIPRGKRSN
jgi:subtilisin family serine protease